MQTEFVFHQADAATVQTVTAGSYVEIALDEDPALHLKWVVDATNNPINLAIVDESKKAEEDGVQRRVFRYIVSGTTASASYNLLNPWDATVAPIQSVVFSFNVN